MSTPKPIETEYNGYRFRSRLEARWAVFFDNLGIDYRYEPEGFDLGEAGWYLPDFWLPDLCCWIEIKPDIGPAMEKGGAADKLKALSIQTNSHGLLLAGDVWPDRFDVILFNQEGLCRGIGMARFALARPDKLLLIISRGELARAGQIDRFTSLSILTIPCLFTYEPQEEEVLGEFISPLTAYRSARQARFEKYQFRKESLWSLNHSPERT